MVKFLAGLFLLLCALVIVAFVYVNRIVSPEWLEAKAEEEFSGDFSFGDVKLVAGWPEATLKVQDATIQEQVQSSSGPHIKAKNLELKVELASLLKQNVVLKGILLDGLKLQMTIPEEGKADISKLFAKKGDEKSVLEDVRTPSSASDSENEEEGKAAKSVTLEELKLLNSDILLHLDKAGITLHFANAHLGLDDIRVDPSSLEKINEAQLDLATQLSVRSQEKDVYALLDLKGPAKVKLFNPLTGSLDPEIETDWILSEKSYIHADTPMLQKAWSLASKLEKLGVRIGEMPEQIPFGKNTDLSLRWAGKELTVLKTLEAGWKNWALQVQEMSWWKTDSDVVNATVSFAASEKFTKKASSFVEKYKKYIPKEIRGESVGAELIKDNRLTIEAGVTGNFEKPRVKLKTEIPSLKEGLNDLLEKGLRSLFN